VCGVSEWDREASIMRRPWPTRGCCAMGGGGGGECIYKYKKCKDILGCVGEFKWRS
jgi:hypothetical protein